MSTLNLTPFQSAFLTSLEAPVLDSFGDGVVLPGGTPATLPGFPNFNNQSAEIKTKMLNGVKSTFAPLVSLLVKETTVITISAFLNGFGVWGDGNYGNGVLRCYKNPEGIVRIHGLFRTPLIGVTSGVAAFQLPVGYRPGPGDNHIFPASSGHAFCSVDVQSSGDVVLGTAVANNTWVSLECQFLAGA